VGGVCSLRLVVLGVSDLDSRPDIGALEAEPGSPSGLSAGSPRRPHASTCRSSGPAQRWCRDRQRSGDGRLRDHGGCRRGLRRTQWPATGPGGEAGAAS